MCKFGIELSHSESPMSMPDSELSQRDVTSLRVKLTVVLDSNDVLKRSSHRNPGQKLFEK